MNNILASIKMMLGILPSDTAFDLELMLHINSALFLLNDIGVGTSGFNLETGNELWSSFETDEKRMQLIKSYVYLKVKQWFDPPQNSTYLNSIENMTKEYEWRLSCNERN